MALSTKELYLVLRARDEASKSLTNLASAFGNVNQQAMSAAKTQMKAGAALVTVGVGLVAAGGAALGWMKGATDAAAEFERQVALVKTQADGVQTSIQELGNITKKVGAEVAVPLDQLNEGLYNIFSSMDVTVPQATMLLEAFAKEAVAGQVDLQDASKATIGILNGFHLPIEEVNHVLDVQFQLVRKGVGTFGEFADVIGRATPSASRAGQSVETLAGMLAYMTRNGMTAANAGSSAARAFDALANPKTVERLQGMGISVKDAAGQFRPMGDIVLDLQGKLAKLTAPERAAALQELFKGAGGTIQARRFYDMVLKDRESAMQFVGLVGDMQKSAGAFGEAYNTMADTTASRSQILANRWQEMKISIGQALLPILNVLISVIGNLVNWWNSLSDRTKTILTIFAFVAAAAAVVIGVIIAIAGAVLGAAAAFVALDVAILPVLIIIAIVVAIIAAVVAAIIYWDDITWGLGKAWEWLKNTAQTVWNAIWGFIKAFGDGFMNIMHSIGDFFVGIWNGIVQGAKAVGDAFVWLYDSVISPVFNAIVTIFKWAIAIIITLFVTPYLLLWKYILAPIMHWFYDSVFKPVMDQLGKAFQWWNDNIVQPVIGMVVAAWKFWADFFTWTWNTIIKPVFDFFVVVWNGAVAQFQVGIDGLTRAWYAVANFFIAVWNSIIKPVIDFFVAVWNGAVAEIRSRIDFLTAIWREMGRLLGEGYQWVVDHVFNPIKDAVHWVGQRFQDIADWIGRAWDSIKDACKKPIQWVIDVVYNNGIRQVWNPLAHLFGLPEAPEVHLATGGIVPINPFKTDGPTAIVGEGNPNYPEYVIPTDPRFGNNASNLWMMAGKDLGYFAEGGVLGEIGNFFSAMVNQGPEVAIKTQMAGVLANADKTPGSGDWREMLVRLPRKAQEGMINAAKNFFKDFGQLDARNFIGSGAQRWAPDVLVALQLLGQSSSLLPNVLRRINQESGGNPMAINLWDSNAAKGIPSMGLMQTILPTFAAYAGPFLGRGVWDPLANIYAGINYAIHRYGNLQYAMDKPGGYRNGGILGPGQLGFNETSTPEYVLNEDQWSAIKGGGLGTTQNFYITTQEIDPRRHAADLGWEIASRPR